MSIFPTVDVLIPYHRVDKFLFQSIDSVLSSIGVQVRIILINDCTGEDDHFVANDDRIYLTKSGGQGYKAAIKHGLDHIQSDFIAFQDSDDLTDSNRLIQQIEILVNTEADICNCLMIRIDKSGRTAMLQPPDLSNNKNKVLPLLLGSYGANSTWVFKKELLEKKDLFNFDSDSLDWNSALMNFRSLKISTLSKGLYFYRYHDLQMTKSSRYYDVITDQLYPAWNALNKSFNLPILNKANFASVCFPPANSFWDVDVSAWAEELLNSKSIDEKDRRAIKEVLGIRATKKLISNQMTQKGKLEIKLLLVGIIYLTKQIVNRLKTKKFL